MNWDIVKGNWKQFKGNALEEWGKLTDDEIDKMNGQREQLEGKLQEKYGWTKEEAHRKVNEWAEKQSKTTSGSH